MVSIFCGVTNCLFASLIISFELFGFADAYYYLIAIATSYMLSGYFGLYHTQRITFSKYENSPTNQRTNHWYSSMILVAVCSINILSCSTRIMVGLNFRISSSICILEKTSIKFKGSSQI